MKAKRVLAGILCGLLLFSQTICVYADELVTAGAGNASGVENVGDLSNKSEGYMSGPADSADEAGQGAGDTAASGDEAGQSAGDTAASGDEAVQSAGDTADSDDAAGQSVGDTAGQNAGTESVDAENTADSGDTVGQDAGTESVDAGDASDSGDAAGQDAGAESVDAENTADSGDTAGQSESSDSSDKVSQNSSETADQDTANAGSDAAGNGKVSDEETSKSADDKNAESESQTDSASKNSTTQKTTSTTVESTTESKKTAVSEDSVKLVSQNEAKEEEDPLADGVSTGDVEYDSIINDPKGYPYVAPASNVYSAIMAMKSQYPEDMTWTNSNLYRSKGYTYQEGRLVGTSGGGCHGFALILSDAAYGSLPLVEHTNFSNIKVGDILRINNDSHSVMITAINGSTITIAEGNYGGKIHWGRTISRTNTSNWSYVITRQRLNVNNFEPYISNSISYTGTARTPTVYYDYLDQGSDFTVAYRNNVNPGTATAIVTGKNNFTGTQNINFTINKATQNFSCDYDVSVWAGETTTIKISGAKTPVTFKSSNTSIATVNNSGVVTGVKAGKVTITATAAENSFYKSTTKDFTIYVREPPKYHQSLYASYSSDLEEGGTVVITIIGASTPVSFQSSDNSVATVNNAGVVTGLKSGIAVITATAAESSRYYSAQTSVALYVREGDKVKAFVRRLYRTTLEREAEESGLNWWVDELKSGRKSGCDVVNGFYSSEELAGRGFDNGKLVELAYQGIMGRSPDGSGKTYWVDKMNAGESYISIVNGFLESPEFDGLCSDYGINKGTPSSSGSSSGRDVSEFVKRLYTKALGRGYDQNGLDYWTNIIRNDSSRGNVLNVSLDGFLHSQEFQSFNLNNEEYVKVLYRTFMGREAEQDGLNYWVNKLNSGVSRDEVAGGFAYSEEFNGIMATYGL